MRCIFLFLALSWSSLCLTAQTFYLDGNGITIKCEDCENGDTGEVDGIVYTCVDQETLYSLVEANDQNLDKVCTSLVQDMYSLFYFKVDFNQDISSWDVSNVTSMNETFVGAESFNQPIGAWDVSNVTDMYGLFGSANSFNQPIGEWDVSAVTDMTNTFQWASDFNQNISDWDVSNVNSMSTMFRHAESFDQPIGDWDVSSVMTMETMFENALVFNQPIGNWDVSNVANLSETFCGASNFNQPIGDWDVANVIVMSRTFADAAAFNQPIGNWNVSNVTNMYDMFMNASSFNQDLLFWNVSSVLDMSQMFDGAISFNEPIGDWDVSNVYNMSGMFQGAGLFDQPLANWDVVSVMLMGAMFQNASSFNQDIHCWCVDQIQTEPLNFSANSPLLDDYLPSWGMDCANDGCSDPVACNYDSTACGDFSDCTYPEEIYLDCDGECLNDIDADGICDELEVLGCTDIEACNYDSTATDDDGSCVYVELYTISGNITPEAFSTEVYEYVFTSESNYEWSVSNGVIINGQGSSQVEVTWASEGLGMLSVVETNIDGCIGPTAIFDVVILPTGIVNLSSSDIGIFPNPVNDILYFGGTIPDDAISWIVTDTKGQHVLRGNDGLLRSINVSLLPIGLYFLTIHSINGQLVKRFSFVKG